VSFDPTQRDFLQGKIKMGLFEENFPDPQKADSTHPEMSNQNST